MTMLPTSPGSSHNDVTSSSPWTIRARWLAVRAGGGRSKALTLGIPALLLTVAAASLASDFGRGAGLAASSAPSQDSDNDGLSNLQEEILCTSADLADTDGDGYSDLEELSRQTDPLNKFQWPAQAGPKVGIVGRTQNGVLTVMTIAYLEGGRVRDLDFQIGLVYRGLAIPLDFSSYSSLSEISLRPARNLSDKLLVIETRLPESLVRALGSLSLFSVHLGDGVSPAVSAVAINLRRFGHGLASLEAAPTGIQGGSGIILRPLGSDDGMPQDWDGGQICWQMTAVVGVNGASIVYEVEAAGCEQMDTYCSPSECAASVGESIELVDPGSLIGG